MATYYVDWDTGDDGDTGLSEALAWKTLEHADGVAGTGDTVHVKNTSTYVLAGNLDITGGTWKGYQTTPGDGGIVTIDGDVISTPINITSGSTPTMENFTVINGSTCWDIKGAAVLKNCQANNGAGGLDPSTGFSLSDANAANCLFIGCSSTGCSSIGFTASGAYGYAVQCTTDKDLDDDFTNFRAVVFPTTGDNATADSTTDLVVTEQNIFASGVDVGDLDITSIAFAGAMEVVEL